MGIHTIHKIIRILENKQHILIAFRSTIDTDAIASAIALKLFFEKTDKKSHIVCDNFVVPKQLSFIPHTQSISPTLGDLHTFVISIDISKNGISHVKYDIKDDTLRLFLTPKNGYLSRESIKTSQTEFKYDAIILLGTDKLPSLGAMYTNHEDFFVNTPMINIDKHATNEHYGHVNLINITASTLSEMIYELLCHAGKEYVSPDIAEVLLTGIISGTNSFRATHIRPATFSIASSLVDLGADRKKIIQKLYNTKTVSTFKLWGVALSHLAHDPAHNIMSTTITRDDFVRTNSKVSDLPAIIDELISLSPHAHYILVLYEHPDDKKHTIHGILKVVPEHHATEVMKKYNAVGDENSATFSFSHPQLSEALQEIIAHVKMSISS